MKRRAFVFSGMAFLLAIPALILAASFISMLHTGSEGIFINIRGEKTFSLFESAEKDLDRAVDIAGRRAVIAAADYISLYGECLTSATYNNPPYGTGAEGAIRELIITGNLTSVNHGVFSSLVTQGSTLQDWIREFSARAEALGFDVDITISPHDIYITPVNDTWYYVTLKVDAIINDSATKRWIYNGTIPRSGNTTRLISGEGIDVSVFTCQQPVANQPPNSTITTPANDSSLTCNTTWINGTASDDSGISQVWIIINSGAEYGTANLTNPGGNTTDWYYSWTPGGNGNYTICSKAVDDDGLEQSPWYCIEVSISGCPAPSPRVCKLEYVSGSAGWGRIWDWNAWSWFTYVWFDVNNTDASNNVTVYNMTVWWSRQSRKMDEIWYNTGSGYVNVNDTCVANNTKVGLAPSQTIPTQDTAEIWLRFRRSNCGGAPTMSNTYFNVTFETDRGVCSVEFNT